MVQEKLNPSHQCIYPLTAPPNSNPNPAIIQTQIANIRQPFVILQMGVQKHEKDLRKACGFFFHMLFLDLSQGFGHPFVKNLRKARTFFPDMNI